MKKTLIALMALAGVAMAAGTGEFYVPVSPSNHVDDFGAGNYSFDFVIDSTDVTYVENAITSLKGGSVLALYAGSYSGGSYYTNGFVLGVTDGAITLTVGRGTLSGLPDSTSPILSTTNLSISQYDYQNGGMFASADGTPITLQVGKSYTIVNVSEVVANDIKQNVSLYVTGESTALATVTYKGNMFGKANTISVWGNATYNVVPEPTTATLSLLALCGLAARRRRR